MPLGYLGICINEEKLVLVPTCSSLTFIGTRLDSVVACVFLPLHHFAALSALIVQLCHQPCMHVYQCYSLLAI